MEEDFWHEAGDERLARGCAEQDPGAIGAFVRRYRSRFEENLTESRRRDGDFQVSVEELGRRAAATTVLRYLQWPGPAPRPSLSAFLDRLRLGDLILAIACSRGSEGAWRVFDERYASFIRSSASHCAIISR